MADDVTLNASTGTYTVATDDVGGKQYQIIKQAFGDLDIATLVSASNPLPVSVGTVPVTGTFYQATQPVSIAAPVAVTGAFWQATQPVSISGTVTVSGGLTDAELRATPGGWAATLPAIPALSSIQPQTHGSFNLQ